MNKLTITLTLCITLIPALLSARQPERQVLSGLGGSFRGELQADYTVGEAVIQSGSSGSFRITQGFQQPGSPQQPTNSIHTAATSTISYRLYPNPGTGKFNLMLQSAQPAQINLSVTAVNGSHIPCTIRTSEAGSETRHSFDISGYAPGHYMLRIEDAQHRQLHTIPFIKTDSDTP